MKNAWRIIIMVVLVAILLGGVGIAVGMMPLTSAIISRFIMTTCLS